MLISGFKDIKYDVPLQGKTFIGVVMDNEDPHKLQRVKVNIDKLFDGIPKKHLPWYSIKQPVGLGGSKGTSSFSVPEVGSTVSVCFPTENIYTGIIDGIIITNQNNQDLDSYTTSDPIQPSDLSVATSVNQSSYIGNNKEDYPNSYGFVDSVKNWFRINKVKKSAEFVHSSGSKFKIDSNGNATLHITGNFKIVVDKDITQSCINRAEAESGVYYHRTDGNSKEIVKSHKNVEVTKNFAESIGGSKVSQTTGDDTVLAANIYLED